MLLWGVSLPSDMLVDNLAWGQARDMYEGVDKDLFWLFFNPSLAIFFYNFLTYLGKKRVNLPSSIYIALTSGISCFSGVFAKKARILPVLLERNAIGVKFQEQWRSNEAPETKENTSDSCRRRTVGCRVCTTVPQMQKLRTVARKTAHLDHGAPWDARLPVHPRMTVRPVNLLVLINFQTKNQGDYVFFRENLIANSNFCRVLLRSS